MIQLAAATAGLAMDGAKLAIGGALAKRRGQGGVDESAFSEQLRVDRVRVWQCPADPATGASCKR